MICKLKAIAEKMAINSRNP